MGKKSEKRVILGTEGTPPESRQHLKPQANDLFITFHIILSDVTVLVQNLLHAAERDSCQVPRILQLQETLEVASCLASSQIDAFAIFSI